LPLTLTERQWQLSVQLRRPSFGLREYVTGCAAYNAALGL